MKCLLDVNAVKAFRKALNALSRIGDDLWLDPTARGLALRAVNSAHSAYGCFLFSPLFFLHYSLGSVSQQGGDATIRCKLSMKCLLPLFRCVTSLECNVERCHISFSGPLTDRLTIQFFCRHGITKTHNLCFQDREALQAVFSSHLCPNVLKAPARLLTDVVMQFPAWQEEVTLLATPHRVALRSHSQEGERDHMRATVTQMLLEPDEFHQVQVTLESQVTFCLKELRDSKCELRAVDRLLEVFSGSLTTPGRPVCFSLDDVLLEATVVLATLVQSGSGIPAAPPPTHRCGNDDVADPPAVATPAASRGHQPDATMIDVVPSSQGSPAELLDELLLLQPNDRLLPPYDQRCSGASPTICSLLFKAASSQLRDCQGLNASLPVLVCDSDEGGAEEEEDEED